MAVMATMGLAGCDRFGDHPEAFISVYTGGTEKISIYERAGYLAVEGVMTLDGADKIAAPINLTTIQCHRDEDPYCEVRRAEIMTMTGSGTVLMNRNDIYSVTAWTPHQVRASSQGECRTSELRIDIPGNSVTEVTENTPGGSCINEATGPVSQPRIARLISGGELERMKKGGL